MNSEHSSICELITGNSGRSRSKSDPIITYNMQINFCSVKKINKPHQQVEFPQNNTCYNFCNKKILKKEDFRHNEIIQEIIRVLC